ncbi:MAG: phosphatidylglycerol lysyltransferase domain-containing protein [Eubacteriaceae bacterium]
MLDFNKVKLSDKEWIKPLLTVSNFNGCHQNFTNLFSWADVYNYRAVKINNFCAVKADYDKDYPYYIYPTGSGDISPVIEQLIKDAESNGHKFTMAGLQKENIDELEQIFPGRFIFTPNRDIFDYIYSIDKLVSLSGNKLHSKRNHINYFKQNFKWSFELIDDSNICDCWDMTVDWCIKNGCKDDPELSEELCSVRKCYKNFKELGLEGGMLIANNKIVAYTMGEILNSNTYVIHIEKAFNDVRGAYQMINQQFAAAVKQNHPHIEYINREEDMGFEGLRKSKLSYYPDILLEKYTAQLAK